MSVVTPFPGQPKRRIIRVPDLAAKLAGAADDLTLIVAEHTFDRDGVCEIAARLRRWAEEVAS